jgi:hypothetical protein
MVLCPVDEGFAQAMALAKREINKHFDDCVKEEVKESEG